MIEPRHLSRLPYFVAVVETRSFTRAAERLGITKAVVSQQVARLEAELGTGLLVRTTRRVEPTDAGRTLYERAAGILRQTQDAFDEIAQASSRPQGTLRIAAPADYGTIMVVPAVTAFLRRYPECTADLRLDDRLTNLLEGELDVSIRVGWLTDSSLRARRLGVFRQVLVGSPELGERLGGLSSPDDLTSLPFVANTVLSEPAVWSFAGPGGEEAVFHAKPTLAIDTTRAVHAALLQGAGISVLPDFVVSGDLADGRLVPVLPEWRLTDGGIHAVFPSARFRPPRVARFIELLAERIGADEAGRNARP